MLDFLFPNHTCLACKGESNAPKNPHICDKCAENLPVNTKHMSLKNRTQKQHFNKAYAAFKYQDPVVGLILRLKYNAESHVATALAPYMRATLQHHKVSADFAIPIPLCKKRQKFRGYNQALLLAKELDLPVLDDVLLRTKITEAQKNMTVDERAENLNDAFEVTENGRKKIKNKRIILVDDVFTSGATTNGCARVLLEAGAKEVNVCSIAAVAF